MTTVSPYFELLTEAKQEIGVGYPELVEELDLDAITVWDPSLGAQLATMPQPGAPMDARIEPEKR
jgi:hypothetical protein